MGRTFWLGVLVLAFGAVGVFTLTRWPKAAPALDCPKEDMGFVDAGEGRGFAACQAPGKRLTPLPFPWARTLGVKRDLNTLSENELADIPGVGKKLAHALVVRRAERNGFHSWEEVGEISGVGPAKLELLKSSVVVQSR